MDNLEKISLRLAKLEKYQKSLKRFQNVTAAKLEIDQDTAAIVERNLQLAIECCIDIAELLIINEHLEKAGDGKEAIIALGKAKILDEKFAYEFSKSVSFRNLLIHEYLDIDYQKVSENLKTNLNDFNTFAQSVAKYLQVK